MNTSNVLDVREQMLHEYNSDAQNKIAILYNAKSFKKINFNSFLDNPNIVLTFLDHDVLAFIEHKDIHNISILYLCFGEWKESYHGILKIIWSMNWKIKIVLVIENVADLPISSLFEFSIFGIINPSTFFRSAYTINESLFNNVYLLDKQIISELQNIIQKTQVNSTQEILSKCSKYKLNYTENQILNLLSEGKRYEDIAVVIEKSMDSVRYYIKSLYKKLNVNNKGAAIRIYLKE